MAIQDLDQRFPIVNPDGTPTQYLMRLLSDRGTAQEDTETEVESLAASLDGKADKIITLTAGTGLSGGGDLSANRTFNLDALIDDLNDVDTSSTAPVDGDVLTWIDANSMWEPLAPTGGGGGGSSLWELAASHTVSGSEAQVDITGLSGYTDILVITRLLTRSSSGADILYVSTNNGSSFYSTSGDYVAITAGSGAESNTTGAGLFATNTTAARSGICLISAANVTGAPRRITTFIGTTPERFFVADTSNDIDAIRVQPTAGNLTAGTVYVFGRVSVGTSGTAFPSSPTDRLRFFRTDLDMEFFWDDANSQWLSTTLYQLSLGNFVGSGSDDYRYNAIPFKGVFDLWMESFQTSTYRTGAGEWDISLRWRDSANAETTLVTVDGNGRTSATWYYDDTAVGSVLSSSAYCIIMVADEISGSTTFFGGGVLNYRLIAT